MGTTHRTPRMVGTARVVNKPLRSLVSKIGGCPAGLPRGAWPVCKCCARPMDFLLQLDLKQPVALSGRYAFAYLFACRSTRSRSAARRCPAYLADAGANQIVLVDAPKSPTRAALPGAKELREFLLVFERAKTPAQKERAARRREEEFFRLMEEAEARADATAADVVEIEIPAAWDEQDLPETVRIGGRPEWLQEPATPRCPVCRGSMRFLAQIDAVVRAWGSTGFLQGYYLPFCGGNAYTFICRNECSDRSAAALWQVD